MPLPTPPSKLGSLLPPDEYKAKARPSRNTKRATDGDTATAAAPVAEYTSPANVAAPMAPAANAPAALATPRVPRADARRLPPSNCKSCSCSTRTC